MRKIMTAVLAVVLMTAILSGCNQAAEKKQDSSVQVYSISGENEYFSLSNGVIVLNTEEEVLYGGKWTNKGIKKGSTSVISVLCVLSSV